MKKNVRLLIPILMILAVSLACTIPGSDASSPEEIAKQIEEAAAATLTALAPSEAPPTEAPADPAPPTDTPEPEATATATPEPVGPAELRLVYNDTNGHLWVWSEGSTPLQIISTGDVSDVRISSDGEWIAFVRRTSGGADVSLWSVRFNGSEERLLVSHADFNAMPLHPETSSDYVLSIEPFQIEFIPGTHTLAFNTYPTFEGPGFFDNKDLWLVDVETGIRSNLLAAGQAGHFYYSPDGSQIALVTPEDVSLINADGSNRRASILTYPMVYTYSEYAYHAAPVWSPDSAFLRVIIPPQDSLGDPSALGQIYQIPTDGTPAALLGNLALGPLRHGNFSPDLNKIAYMQQVGAAVDNTWSINFANYDGSASSEFARGQINFLTWAPDSSHFAFDQYSPRSIVLGQAGIVGSTLVDANPSTDLTWVDGNRYFFFYQTAPEWQLRLGTLGAPSTVIANLGSGSYFTNYDFVSP